MKKFEVGEVPSAPGKWFVFENTERILHGYGTKYISRETAAGPYPSKEEAQEALKVIRKTLRRKR